MSSVNTHTAIFTAILILLYCCITKVTVTKVTVTKVTVTMVTAILL